MPSQLPKKPLLISLGIVVLLLLAAVIAIQSRPRQQQDPVLQGENVDQASRVISQNKTLPLLPYQIVYGVWSRESSIIKSYDLSSHKLTALANLPSNIKKISFLNKDKLLFIQGTDEKDQGLEIVTHIISQNKTSTVLHADNGFRIDEYVLSLNKRFLALWEVSLNPNSHILSGGKSRVYSFDLTKPYQGKQLIYDEDGSTDPQTRFHYPKGVTDDGEIFLDTFVPNTGAGWAYGMSIASSSGTLKKDLPIMQNGTYGTQPQLSPKGDYLVFTGYDGLDGDQVIDGFRQSIIASNTVELFDTRTKQREKLPLTNQNIYSTASWDKVSGNIIYTQLSQDPNQTGVYLYNLVSKKVQLVNKEPAQRLIGSLNRNQLLVATLDPSSTTMGNLGESYSAAIGSFFLLDQQSSNQTLISLPDLLMQFIALVPINSDVLGEQVSIFEQDPIGRSLQITLLPIKPQLFNVRSTLSNDPPQPPPATSEPPPSQPQPQPPAPLLLPVIPLATGSKRTCDLLVVAQCLDANGVAPDEKSFCLAATNKCAQHLIENRGREQGQRLANSIRKCYEVQSGSGTNNSCSLSPLYLYGRPNQEVKLEIGTLVTSYPKSRVHLLQLNSSGQSTLDFNYLPAIKKIEPPKQGFITSYSNLASTLAYLGANLGLNDAETADLINTSQQSINSPFVFISFFDEETSKKILPINFDPKPDTYENIVFYFKKLEQHPPFSPLPPKFPQIPKRKGFTAVEISELIE